MILKDRIKESTATTGTGSYILDNIAAMGYRTFNSSVPNGGEVPYCVSRWGEFEVGIGTWTSSTLTLSRDTIITSSNAGSAVNWGSGNKEVSLVYISSNYPTITSSNPTASNNPLFIGKKAINSITGEVFICTDNTVDSNYWQGQLGTIIEKLVYYPTATILDSFPSPGTYPLGLAFDGTNLISNELNDPIYIHDGVSSTILDSFPYPGSSPRGITIANSNLISCDNSLNTIYVHDGISSTILDSFASPSTTPTGLTFDGTNLISCDNRSDTIYVHDGISSTILDSFASPSTTPTGLTFDGTNLISCDNRSDTIYVHDGISSTILTSISTPGSYIYGLTFDGTNLISCDYVTDTIYVHDREIAP